MQTHILRILTKLPAELRKSKTDEAGKLILNRIELCEKNGEIPFKTHLTFLLDSLHKGTMGLEEVAHTIEYELAEIAKCARPPVPMSLYEMLDDLQARLRNKTIDRRMAQQILQAIATKALQEGQTEIHSTMEDEFFALIERSDLRPDRIERAIEHAVRLIKESAPTIPDLGSDGLRLDELLDPADRELAASGPKSYATELPYFSINGAPVDPAEENGHVAEDTAEEEFFDGDVVDDSNDPRVPYSPIRTMVYVVAALGGLIIALRTATFVFGESPESESRVESNEDANAPVAADAEPTEEMISDTDPAKETVVNAKLAPGTDYAVSATDTASKETTEISVYDTGCEDVTEVIPSTGVTDTDSYIIAEVDTDVDADANTEAVDTADEQSVADQHDGVKLVRFVQKIDDAKVAVNKWARQRSEAEAQYVHIWGVPSDDHQWARLEARNERLEVVWYIKYNAQDAVEESILKPRRERELAYFAENAEEAKSKAVDWAEARSAAETVKAEAQAKAEHVKAEAEAKQRRIAKNAKPAEQALAENACTDATVNFPSEDTAHVVAQTENGGVLIAFHGVKQAGHNGCVFASGQNAGKVVPTSCLSGAEGVTLQADQTCPERQVIHYL